MSKQIVPEGVIHRIARDWYDMPYGTRPPFSEHVANRAAAWALEASAKACDEKARSAYLVWKDSGRAYYEGFGDAMDEAAAELRAMIGEGGNGV
jgi:hypothetical protein